jgi:hypothetical protein
MLDRTMIKASVPYQTPQLMKRFLEGMRKAGLRDERVLATSKPNKNR